MKFDEGAIAGVELIDGLGGELGNALVEAVDFLGLIQSFVGLGGHGETLDFSFLIEIEIADLESFDHFEPLAVAVVEVHQGELGLAPLFSEAGIAEGLGEPFFTEVGVFESLRGEGGLESGFGSDLTI